MNPNLRGAFIGLSMAHERRHFVRAIMEGVTFAIKSGYEILREYYGQPVRVVATGGAAKSGLWLQMIADILNVPLVTTKVKEKGCLGAAMTAGVACGVFRDLDEAVAATVRYGDGTIVPGQGSAARYEDFFRTVYSRVYDGNKDVMREICRR
jgi:xylulokinase